MEQSGAIQVEYTAEGTFSGPRLRATEKGEIYQGEIVEASQSTSTYNNNLQLKLVLQTAEGARLTQWYDIPVNNPTVAGHKFAATNEVRTAIYKKGRELVRAVLGPDAIPALPRKPEGSENYVDADGAAMSKAAVAAAFTEANSIVGQQMASWFNNPAQLAGSTVFFGTRQPDGSKYLKVSYVRHDDGGATVLSN